MAQESFAKTGRRTLERWCVGAAFVGGIFMFCAMMVVVGSVAGGAFGKPLLGDSEVVDLMIGVAVFCFLPYCHLHGGNIVVDFFARPLPKSVQHWLDAVMNVLLGAVALFMAWRLGAGGITAFERSKYSMFLELPEWPVYLVGTAASVLWIAVILFAAYEAMLRARGKLAAPSQGVEFG